MPFYDCMWKIDKTEWTTLTLTAVCVYWKGYLHFVAVVDTKSREVDYKQYY